MVAVENIVLNSEVETVRKLCFPMPQSGCFIIQLPRRVLRVYRLVGLLTRERVSGVCFRSNLPRVYRP